MPCRRTWWLLVAATLWVGGLACGGGGSTTDNGTDDGADEGGADADADGDVDADADADSPAETEAEAGADADADGSGHVISAASCSSADVQAALDEAGRGDVVSVPAGACTWAAGITITRGVKLEGAGVGATIITDATDEAVRIEPDATAIAEAEVIELSDFTFDGGGRSTGNFLGVSAPNATPFRGLVVHDCQFREMRWGSRCLLVGGSVYGVIYDNDFDRIAEVIGYFSGDGSSWSAHYPALPAFGDADKLYLEDNTVRFSSAWADEPGWFETGQGAPGIAVRYNTFDHTNVSVGYHEGWDIHGLQTPPACEQYSTISAEYYGNVRIAFNGGRLMNLRGGSLLLFDNVITGTTRPSIEINEYACDDCAVGGEMFPQHVHDAYVWNNFFGGSEVMDIGVSMNNCGSYAITENRDYFNYSSSCSGSGTCSGGIGVGPAVPTGSCTSGTGFWVTSRAAGDGLPATMAELRTLAQEGRLYRCNAGGSWELFYAPYPYPHPLRPGG
jgi:hypothetical protein